MEASKVKDYESEIYGKTALFCKRTGFKNFEDALQDAWVIVLENAESIDESKGEKQTRNFVATKVYYGLIDKYRRDVKYRYFKKRGERPIRFLSLDRSYVNEKNEAINDSLQEGRAVDFSENVSFDLFVKKEKEERSTDEFMIVVERVLRRRSRRDVEMFREYYFDGTLSKDVGKKRGLSESRASQLRAEIKREIYKESIDSGLVDVSFKKRKI